MQTFVPYPSAAQSAACLDRQRLGKQRVECLQILKTLVIGGGWSNHPAVRMWSGHEAALIRYSLAVCDEWVGRGYRDTCAGKIRALLEVDESAAVADPPWWGTEVVHRSHRSNLLRKDSAHYRRFWPKERADLPYTWPV